MKSQYLYFCIFEVQEIIVQKTKKREGWVAINLDCEADVTASKESELQSLPEQSLKLNAKLKNRIYTFIITLFIFYYMFGAYI